MAKKEWLNRSKLELSSRRRAFINALKNKGWEFHLINNFLLEQQKIGTNLPKLLWNFFHLH